MLEGPPFACADLLLTRTPLSVCSETCLPVPRCHISGACSHLLLRLWLVLAAGQQAYGALSTPHPCGPLAPPPFTQASYHIVNADPFLAVSQVYRAVMEALPWTDLLQPNQSFAVEARVRSCTNLTNSQLLVVRAKDAMCDYIRDRRWVRHG